MWLIWLRIIRITCKELRIINTHRNTLVSPEHQLHQAVVVALSQINFKMSLNMYSNDGMRTVKGICVYTTYYICFVLWMAFVQMTFNPNKHTVYLQTYLPLLLKMCKGIKIVVKIGTRNATIAPSFDLIHGQQLKEFLCIIYLYLTLTKHQFHGVCVLFQLIFCWTFQSLVLLLWVLSLARH